MAGEFTPQAMHQWCNRIVGICNDLTRGTGQKDGVVSDIVTTIQKIGEGIVWAYQNKQRDSSRLGESFAQSFLDVRMCDQFRELLREKPNEVLSRDSQNRIDSQILQTTLILVKNTPKDSSLLAYLLSGWFLNDVIAHRYNWRNEDTLNLWVVFLKEIAMLLNGENIMLFFNPGDPSRIYFPIFSEAARFYQFPEQQVRTAVQIVSLEIFTHFTDESLQEEQLFAVICMEAQTYFTHVCCLLREFWVFLNGERERIGALNGGQANPRDIRLFDNMQGDIIHYVNDVLNCKIPRITEIIVEKLLCFAILPILVRSALVGDNSSLTSYPGSGPNTSEGIIAPSAAWYLLHDILVHVNLQKAEQLNRAIALTLLRNEIPAKVLQLVTSPAPRTPLSYSRAKSEWAPGTPQRFQREHGDTTTDEHLYSMPPVPLAMQIEVPTAVLGARQVQNSLLESLLRILRTPPPVEDDPREKSAIPLTMALNVLRMLLRAMVGSEPLADNVVQLLLDVLCKLLAHGGHHSLHWSAVEAALGAIADVATASADPPRARAQAERHLRTQVLQPLASRILSSRQVPEGGSSEQWLDLDSYLEQWRLHRQHCISHKERNSEDEGAFNSSSGMRRHVLERTPLPRGTQGPSEGQPRHFRLLLELRRLCFEFKNSSGVDQWLQNAPGLGEIEEEDRARFCVGTPTDLGKENRLKCTMLEPAGSKENFYLVNLGSLFVLVQPDSHTPFWAVPTHVEPLRNVHMPADDPGSSYENGRGLRLVIESPMTPGLGGDRPNSGSGAVPPSSAGALSLDDFEGAATAPSTATIELLFQDVARRRMAAAFLAQGRERLLSQLSERLERVLVELRDS